MTIQANGREGVLVRRAKEEEEFGFDKLRKRRGAKGR